MITIKTKKKDIRECRIFLQEYALVEFVAGIERIRKKMNNKTMEVKR